MKKMKNNKVKKIFDIRCLDELNIDELESILKSNVISWKIRSEIIFHKNQVKVTKIIKDYLPLIASIGVAIAVEGAFQHIMDKIKD